MIQLCKHSWQCNTDCVRTVKINRKERLQNLKEESHRRVGSLHSTAQRPLCVIKCTDEKQVTTIRENSNRNAHARVCVCARARARACVRVCVHTHACLYACMHVCVALNQHMNGSDKIRCHRLSSGKGKNNSLVHYTSEG